MRVVPNPLQRYNVNSYWDLAPNPDGSLTLAVGVTPAPGVDESTWLPAQSGKPFSLTFRAYVPKDGVARSGWTTPGITPVEA